MTSSVLVIGGGAVGMSVALHLRWRGAEVRLVERGALGGGCSQLGGGWVAAQGRRNPDQLAFALDSIGYYPQFLARVGETAGFRQSGSLLLLETDKQIAERREFLANQKSVKGYDGFEFLSPEELHDLEPAIASPHIAGGTYRARDCQIDPPAFVAALAAALRRDGITVVEGAQVESLHKSAAGWQVRTTLGDYGADAVVNAAGYRAPEISAMAGTPLPMSPVSGQIMTTAPYRPYVNALVVVAHNHAIPNCPARDLRQGADGRLWIGTLNHHGSADAAVRRTSTEIIRAAMARIFPELADIPFDHGYAGTRPTAADGLPVYGAAGDAMFLAVPMSGIAEAAAAGRTIADLVLDGACPALPHAFSPLRLSAPERQRAAAG
jgi:glycine/D-amino acid oxidase-like deaminating enzyme